MSVSYISDVRDVHVMFLIDKLHVCVFTSEGPSESEERMPEQENGQTETEEGMDGADFVDLSSINSMMTTVMKAGQLNGVETPSTTPTKNPIKSPGASRNSRKNQVCVLTHSHHTNTKPLPLCAIIDH